MRALKKSLYDAISRENEEEDVNTSEIVLETKIKGVDLLPSNIDLSRAEIELMNIIMPI